MQPSSQNDATLRAGDDGHPLIATRLAIIRNLAVDVTELDYCENRSDAMTPMEYARPLDHLLPDTLAGVPPCAQPHPSERRGRRAQDANTRVLSLASSVARVAKTRPPPHRKHAAVYKTIRMASATFASNSQR